MRYSDYCRMPTGGVVLDPSVYASYAAYAVEREKMQIKILEYGIKLLEGK